MGDPSIEERMTDILRLHEFWTPAKGYKNVRACACGWKAEWPMSDHMEHLVDVLVAELGLTQEWGSRSPEGWGPWTIYHGKSDAEGSARRSDVLHSRFVTDWERAE